jgi:hypothetical protein
MKRTALPFIILLSASLLGGCRDDEQQADVASSPPAAAATTEGEHSRLASDKTTSEAPARVQRKLIHNAELHVEVASYQEARRSLDKQLGDVAGYVADARIEHHDGEISRAELTLRIPTGQLHAFLADAAGYGKVQHESLKTQDVTDAYYDAQARMKNAKRLEARLLELVTGNTANVKQLLEVERELARVREKIERFEGQIQLYDNKVSHSTLKLQLITRRAYAAGTPVGLGESLVSTLGKSWTVMVGAGRTILVVLAALLPWLFPLTLLGWLLRAAMQRYDRRRRRQRASQEVDTSTVACGSAFTASHASP